MTILALDLATVLGFAVGDPETGLPRLGHHRLPSTGRDQGHFAEAGLEALEALVANTRPDWVVYESPIISAGGRGVNLDVSRKLIGLSVIAELAVRRQRRAQRREIGCREVSIQTVKKALSGSGRAKKPEMVRAARAYGLDPQDDNEADAFGIWLCAVNTMFPRLAYRFSPMFRPHG